MDKDIHIQNVSKLYSKKYALDKVTTTVKSGTITGFLGRNGAGKTTLMSIICNRRIANSGIITIGEEKVFENDRLLSQFYMTSPDNLYPKDTKVKEILHYTEKFYENYDKEYADKLVKKFHLDVNKNADKLSTGFQSILKLICCLSTNAEYMIFDEPVLGLDANNRDAFYKLLLEKFLEINNTIILSTHIISEIESLIENIIVIDEGKIILEESVEDLLKSGYQVSGTTPNVEKYIEDKDILSKTSLGNLMSVSVLGERPNNNNENLDFSNINLQDLFIKLTNEREEI